MEIFPRPVRIGLIVLDGVQGETLLSNSQSASQPVSQLPLPVFDQVRALGSALWMAAATGAYDYTSCNWGLKEGLKSKRSQFLGGSGSEGGLLV